MFYAETYILPWTAQCQLQMLRAHFTLQPTHLDYQNIIAVNDQCARLWGRRGIAVQVKEPTPLFEEEEGTVLEVSWKRTWMRKERRIATRTKSTPQAEVRSISPGQDGASTTLPSFLRYLPEWLVVLCVEHRECFAQDTLRHHLIQKHSATEEEATDVISLSPIDYAAKSWEYVIHPYKAIDRIPELPTIMLPSDIIQSSIKDSVF
ncbi:hypothetical protein FQN51_000003 [Onygenales sp. PD_10]|nr:hypothetical protein FQN51_000003 [Onygenales sp. PD_10]